MSRDDDQAWAELVDSFNASADTDGDQPWPDAEDIDPSLDDEAGRRDRDDDGRLGRGVGVGELGRGNGFGDRFGDGFDDDSADGPRQGADSHDDEAASDHFVPPTPTPIPRGDAVSRLAWAAVIGGPLGLIVAAVLSWRPSDELLLFAVMAFVAGFVTLIARMRERRPDDPDNGAVL